MSHTFDDAHHNEEWDEDYVSKSQMKRESEALQQLGEELVSLKPTELAKVPLDEELQDAVELGQRLQGKREALRRHLQFIGRLMRSRDISDIEKAMDEIRSRHQSSNVRLHKLEQWRERLIEEGDPAINELLGQFHELDRQKLRQLSRQARKERLDNRPPVAFRELFQYLRGEIETRL